MPNSTLFSTNRLLLLTVLALTYYTYYLTRHSSLRPSLSGLDWYLSSGYEDFSQYPRTLGIASRIYVPSFEKRWDRRANMSLFACELGLDLSFTKAVDMRSDEITNIIDDLRLFRHTSHASFHWLDTSPSAPSTLSRVQLLRQIGPDVPPPSLEGWLDPVPPEKRVNETGPMAFNRDDDKHQVWSSKTGDWQTISPAKIACWESHLRILLRVAALPRAQLWLAEEEDRRRGVGGRRGPRRVRGEDAVVVLEDDVDMEADVKERLAGLWHALPAEWDIVFLGHCFSSEYTHGPISTYTPPKGSGFHGTTSLRPSQWPQCTHGYAVSIPGALRILAHLEYEPFAYSRSIDQAYMWLIKSGRVRSWSVTPAVVVQRKTTGSDIAKGEEQIWDESLYKGVLEGWVGGMYQMRLYGRERRLSGVYEGVFY